MLVPFHFVVSSSQSHTQFTFTKSFLCSFYPLHDAMQPRLGQLTPPFLDLGWILIKVQNKIEKKTGRMFSLPIVAINFESINDSLNCQSGVV